MAQSEAGALLAELKARSGLSWQALAETIGASSGDYVRKVASGAKPGANLTAAARELTRTGTVTELPSRRRAKSGELARVRAAPATGAKSRQPSEFRSRDPRSFYKLPGGRYGWSIEFDIGDDDGIAAELDRVKRARGRVSFEAHVVVHTDYGDVAEYVPIGQKGGYTVRDVLARIRKAGSVEDWVDEMLKDMPKGQSIPRTFDEVVGLQVNVQ